MTFDQFLLFGAALILASGFCFGVNYACIYEHGSLVPWFPAARFTDSEIWPFVVGFLDALCFGVGCWIFGLLARGMFFGSRRAWYLGLVLIFVLRAAGFFLSQFVLL